MLPADHPLTAAAIRVLPVGIIMLAMTRTRPVGHLVVRLMVWAMLNIGIFQALLFIAAYRLPVRRCCNTGRTPTLVVVLLSWFMLNAPHSR